MAEFNVNKYADHKTYDGQPLPAGMVLVPVWFTRDMLGMYTDVLRSNLTTWHFGGSLFLIGFAPIDPACFPDYMRWFWQGINGYMDERRAVRRSIETFSAPLTDPDCCEDERGTDCPGPDPDRNRCRTAAQAEDEVISLDALQARYDFDFRDYSKLSPEDALVMKDTFSQLLNYLHAIKPRYAEIAALGYAGLTPREILLKLHLKPSRGYQEIDTCFRLAKAFIYGG